MYKGNNFIFTYPCYIKSIDVFTNQGAWTTIFENVIEGKSQSKQKKFVKIQELFGFTIFDIFVGKAK